MTASSSNGDTGRSSSSTTTTSMNNGNHNRRRRRMIGSAGTTETSSSQPLPTTTTVATTEDDDGDYYSDSDNNNDGDDDDSSDDERQKGHNYYKTKKNDNQNKKKTYKNACSMGRFFLNPCLCCWNSIRNCFCHDHRFFCRHFIQRLLSSFIIFGGGKKQLLQRSSSKKKQQQQLKNLDQTDLLLVVVIIFLLFVSFYFLFPSLYYGIFLPMTSSYYEDGNRLSILIPALDRRRTIINLKSSSSVSSVDIGGWMMVQKQINKPTKPIDIGQPDRGNLLFYGPFGKERQIRQQSIDDDVIAGIQYNIKYPKTREVSKHNLYNEQIEDLPDACRRVNWKMLYNPTCNEIHSIPLSRDYDEEEAIRVGDDQQFDSFYISHGYFRDVWVVNQLGLFGTTPKNPGPKTVIKISRWKRDLTIGELQKDLRDAVVMERLTASPRIVDIYSHCGMAIQVEALPYEVEEIIVPGSGYTKQDHLHDIDDVKPKNDYTANEKLQIALAMAESLADLHGFKDGVIVHDDVQLCQWLRNYDGKLKLGDFNRAEIMDYNENEKEYCVYNNGNCYGNYRAPEEFDAADLNEKIDVFSFGNNIYALLTGLWVFYTNEDDEVVQEKIIKGDTAYIDPRYRTRSLAEKRLVEVMEKCWALKPEDRIDIFEAVRLLREAVEEVKNSNA